MKSKKKLNFIILIVLFMSIGFAVLTVNLGLNGQVSFRDNTWDVHFENIKFEDSSIEVKNADINNLTINFTTSEISRPGDYLEFYVDLVNAGTMDATLSSVTKTQLQDDYAKYLNYDVTYFSDRQLQQGDLLKSGTTSKIKVRLEYKYDLDNYIKLNDLDLSCELNYVKTDTHADGYVKNVWDFDFVGESTIFKAPYAGNYKIETWGAQGGNVATSNKSFTGGYGGYSVGTVSLEKDEKLFVTVGGAGKSCFGKNCTVLGGYNGGAPCRSYFDPNHSYDTYCGSGGGLTAVYTSDEAKVLLGKDQNLGGNILNHEIQGDSLIIKDSPQGYLYIFGRESRKAGEYFKVEWKGEGLSNSKIEFDGGIFRQGDEHFYKNEGIEIYNTKITDTLVEIWYKITEDSDFTEFRLLTNGQTVKIDSETIIKINDPLILSGAGGGAAYTNDVNYGNGGHGGGIKGTDATSDAKDFVGNGYGTGGTQEEGGGVINRQLGHGNFGVGGKYDAVYIGGGAGYWGGGGPTINSAGGGSGYIGNSKLKNKSMYCYDCEVSADANTKTVKVTNASGDAKSQYVKIGNGYARITYIG